MRSGKKESPRSFTEISICAARRASVRYAKPKRNQFAPTGYAARFVAGIKRLIEMSGDDRQAIGNRGRDLVATKFSWPRIGEQMRSIYEWSLGAGPTPEVIVK